MGEPNFDDLDATAVRAMIDEVLGGCMETRWREAWWSSDFPNGRTPTKLLEAGRYTELWLLADAMCDPDARDITGLVNLN